MKVLQRQPCIHISKNRRNLVKPNMSKLTTLLTALLLFTFMLSYSATARPDPTQLKVRILYSIYIYFLIIILLNNLPMNKNLNLLFV